MMCEWAARGMCEFSAPTSCVFRLQFGSHIMRRREFVFLFGGTVTWPLAARAQQSAKPVIGFLSISSPGPHAPFVAAFNEGLRQLGFTEGQNLAIEYQSAEVQFNLIPPSPTHLLRPTHHVTAA